MQATIKLQAVGNEVGAVLPAELLHALGVGPGDELTLVRTRSGFEIHASPLHEEMDRVISDRYRRALGGFTA